MNGLWKRMAPFVMAALCAISAAVTARADLWDTSGNEYVKQSAISRGKIGKSMNVTMQICNPYGPDWKDVYVKIDTFFNTEGGFLPGADNEYREEVFPFEAPAGKMVSGGIQTGKSKTISIPVKVRADIPEGYYRVKVQVYQDWSRNADSSGEGGIPAAPEEYINVYVSPAAAGDTDDTQDINKQIVFTLGEGQPTPYGIYPNVLNYSINMRNSGLSDARDVTVEMVLSAKSEEFPFDINDGSYDRYFETVAAGETVQLPYSMAIREDTYSGFYELKFKIHYRETATGDMKEQEESFWVRIKNKEHEEEKSSQSANENNRSYARIVVDSYETIPETIIAGEPFQLVLRMQNAAYDIPATNILLDLESEAATSGGGAVFTTLSGSSSYVVNSLKPEEISELRLDMQATAGIDQRTYYLKIKETYDSPEFKNAKAETSINIPVRQVARLNTGTIEVEPGNIIVGAESYAGFQINNTGKVLLYNVTVAFEADSIVPTDYYVGNIEPGKSGTVDCPLTGAAPTTDNGKVKIIITYEDENGEVQEPVEKELTLMVSEPVEENYEDAFAGQDFDMSQEQPSFVQQYFKYLAAAAAIVAVILVVSLTVMRRKRKVKKELEELEGSDDEIS